VTKITNTIGVI